VCDRGLAKPTVPATFACRIAEAGIFSENIADVQSVSRVCLVVVRRYGMGYLVHAFEGAEVIFVIVKLNVGAVEAGG
jgi:hypothetical protein